eukprot:scaffold21949_cov110-Isochrysis_galbana.AAC.3
MGCARRRWLGRRRKPVGNRKDNQPSHALPSCLGVSDVDVMTGVYMHGKRTLNGCDTLLHPQFRQATHYIEPLALLGTRSFIVGAVASRVAHCHRRH